MCELVAFGRKPSDPIDVEQIKAAVGQDEQELRALPDAVGRQRLESELTPRLSLAHCARPPNARARRACKSTRRSATLVLSLNSRQWSAIP